VGRGRGVSGGGGDRGWKSRNRRKVSEVGVNISEGGGK